MLNILRDRQTDRQTDRQNNYTLSEEIKKLLKKIPGLLNLVRRIRKPIRFYQNLHYAHKHTFYNPESKIKFDRTPYIIHCDDATMGLFGYFNMILGGISFADKNNFIPVIDMKNYKSPYISDDELGRVNAWEYYFEQPGNISLEDVYSSQKYMVGINSLWHDWPNYLGPQNWIRADFYYNRGGALSGGKLDYWRKLCKKYIRFKPAVLERLGALQEKTKGKKILGVLVRGTDFTATKPSGHLIPPSPEQAIEKAREVLREKNFDAVYLATEDKNIVAKFQAAFNEKNLFLPEQDYVEYDSKRKKFLYEYEASCKNGRYLRGLDYLVSMLFLSKCSGFITSITSGPTGVMCLSEGFEYLYVFDLGVYA